MRTATFTSNEGDTYMKITAALRNSGDGWHVIDDGGHEPLGITIGAVTSTTLEILFPNALQVCDVVCGADEGFAKPPYKATFGASVGLNRAIIQGTVSGVIFNPQTWSSASANIWVSGWMLVAEAPATA
jgi:hypothetical protein